jgi:hypothetical protein
MFRLLPLVHQNLREPRVPDDRVDNQRVLAQIGDAVRVILVAEGDGVLQPVEEGGRCLLRGEDLVPLPLALVLTVKIRQPSHEFTFGVGMTFVSYSLVLTPVV